jgi:hypothetical protein
VPGEGILEPLSTIGTLLEEATSGNAASVQTDGIAEHRSPTAGVEVTHKPQNPQCWTRIPLRGLTRVILKD